MLWWSGQTTGGGPLVERGRCAAVSPRHGPPEACWWPWLLTQLSWAVVGTGAAPGVPMPQDEGHQTGRGGGRGRSWAPAPGGGLWGWAGSRTFCGLSGHQTTQESLLEVSCAVFIKLKGRFYALFLFWEAVFVPGGVVVPVWGVCSSHVSTQPLLWAAMLLTALSLLRVTYRLKWSLLPQNFLVRRCLSL